MPPPDQFFYSTLRRNFDDYALKRSRTPPMSNRQQPGVMVASHQRSVTPTQSSKYGRGSVEPSPSAPIYRSNRSRTTVVQSSNVTTSSPPVSLQHNRYSAAEVKSPTPNFQLVATPRMMSTGATSPFVGTSQLPSTFGRRAQSNRRLHQHVDDEEIPQLRALERTLEEEMGELQKITQRLEERMSRVLQLEDERQNLLRIAQHQQRQQQQQRITSSSHSGVDSSPLQSSRPLPLSPRTHHHQQLQTTTPPQNRSQRTASSDVFSSVDDDSEVLVEMPSEISLADSGTKRREPSVDSHHYYNIRGGLLPKDDGPILLRSAQRPSHYLDDKMMSSRVRRNEDVRVVGVSVVHEEDSGSNDDDEDDDPVVIDLSGKKQSSNRMPREEAESEISNIRQNSRDRDDERRLDVLGLGNCADALHHATSSRVASSSMLILAQCHGTRSDLLAYESELLQLQDELIKSQRSEKDGGCDVSDVDAAVAMHLRLVLRDELSACKEREKKLAALEVQLEKQTVRVH